MKQILIAFFAWFVVVLMGGCLSTIKHDGVVGVKFSQSAEIFSTAKQTTDEAATFEFRSQPVEAWIKAKTEPETGVEGG